MKLNFIPVDWTECFPGCNFWRDWILNHLLPWEGCAGITECVFVEKTNFCIWSRIFCLPHHWRKGPPKTLKHKTTGNDVCHSGFVLWFGHEAFFLCRQINVAILQRKAKANSKHRSFFAAFTLEIVKGYFSFSSFCYPIKVMKGWNFLLMTKPL